MSRLDSFIRRMTAQRDILDSLPGRLAAVPGLVAEVGLGNGRTYDHLRSLFPDRRIVVFESILVAGPAALVPDPDLVLGDIRDTATRFPDGCAALVHADIETGDPACDASIVEWLPAIMTRLLTRGGFAVSGAALPDPRLAPEPLPKAIPEERYHLLRRL